MQPNLINVGAFITSHSGDYLVGKGKSAEEASQIVIDNSAALESEFVNAFLADCASAGSTPQTSLAAARDAVEVWIDANVP